LETSRAEALHDLDRNSIGNLGLFGSPATNSAAMATGRWAEFCWDNHLQVGDVCVFEFVRINPVLLNALIFHVADYILTKQ
jgi:hypothetical protein